MAFFSSNPAWSDPITSFIAGSLSERLFGRGDHVFHREAEFLQEVFQRSGRAKCAHAHDLAVGAGVTLPSKSRSHFNGDASRDRGWQNTFLVGGVLLFKKFPRRNA